MENDIPVELQVVDLMKGEHYQDWYTKINPNRLVPVLDDDGFILTESSAILKYLAEKIGSPTYPRDLKKRARINEVMDWLNTQFYREYAYHMVYPQIFPHHKRQTDEINRATTEWGREKAAHALSILDQNIIGENPYLCGQELTVADFFGAALVTLGDHVRVNFDKYPNVKRWLGKMRSLKSWAKCHEVHDGFAASLKDKPFVSIE
jgi:glutathione S-transferase